MKRVSHHVVPQKSGSGWAVKKSEAKKASANVNTQNDAIQRAKELARNSNSDVYVHGKDGKIIRKISPK